MLRFIHTADWHLGQTFHNYDRDAEHAAFLSHLLTSLKARRPHALIVAGDVFDVVNPSAEAQRRYYDFLARTYAEVPGLQIVITAGNHDAASRLEAPSDLLNCLNIRVVGTVGRNPDGEIDLSKFLVPLKDESGQVKVIALAVPYLRQADVPIVEGAQNAYLAGVKELYRRVTQAAIALRDAHHPGATLIALGHCHMQSGDTSPDSERKILIGGEENLASDTFPPELAYVALGHLHKPQDTIDSGRIRYCGSPIPLSFSETGYRHRLLEIAVADGRVASTDSILIPHHTHLLRLPAKAASTDEVVGALTTYEWDNSLPPDRQPFLEVRLLDTGPEPDRRARIEKALEGKPVRLASLKLERPAATAASPLSATDGTTAPLESLHSLDPRDLFRSAYLEEHGSAPSDELIAVLNEVISCAESAESPAHSAQ